ncbi:hypothetical protein AMR72_02450 [Flavobacterium psychrophilum]|nr:hypothetical protein AMR72_02450 [Flavobacterium psychrophilum]AOE51479.1 hypothetical protein ALW18_02450 [Flavobacterium psychrophilum]
MSTKIIDQNLLESFLLKFIPEDKVTGSSETELRYISSLISDLLYHVNYFTTIDAVFTAFENLSYPISVIEPLKKGNCAIPYVQTNSNTIYIGVQTSALKKISEICNYYETPGFELPPDRHKLYLDFLKLV